MKAQDIKISAAIAVSLFLGVAPSPAVAQTEIFRSMTNERCSDASRDAIANAARRNVENHVARAEASIQPPTPVGDLSCLNDLMNVNIDFLSGQFFSLDSLLGDFMSGLQNITLEGIGQAVGNQVGRQICAFAQEKWSELTEPLNLSLDDIVGDIAPGFTSNFALINVSQGQSGSGVTINGGAGLRSAPPATSGSANTGVQDAMNSVNSGVRDAIDQIYDSLNGGN